MRRGYGICGAHCNSGYSFRPGTSSHDSISAPIIILMILIMRDLRNRPILNISIEVPRDLVSSHSYNHYHHKFLLIYKLQGL
jgi:hypothetical protein